MPVSTGCGNYSEIGIIIICYMHIIMVTINYCEMIHALCNTVSADSNIEITKFVIFGGVGGAGFATGAIIVCLLLAMYRLTLHYRSKRQDLVGIEVESNAAYETVNFQKVYSEVQ
jgi:hypothetical protein